MTSEPAIQGEGHGDVAPAPARDDSFATYLIKLLITEKSFQPGMPPEAAGLAAPGVFVLSKHDGFTLSMVCVVNAETNPERRFPLNRDEILRIGSACKDRYSGKVNGQQMPVVIELIEVRGSVTEQDVSRVTPLTSPGSSGVNLTTYLVDTTASTVNATKRSFFRRFLEKTLKGPRMSDEELRAYVSPELGPGWPVVTLVMLAVLVGVFALELVFPVTQAGNYFMPNVRTLAGMGGLYHPDVAAGGWYRLLTSALLHGTPEHLVLNAFAFFLAGVVLEKLLGRAWLFALFLIGAVGGSLASLAINPPEMISVGASGAITGLLAAATVCIGRLRDGPERTRIITMLMGILVPALLPLAMVRNEGRIDYAAHLGGALAGGAVGVLLLQTWRRTEARPRFTRFATVLALVGVALFCWSGWRALGAYQVYVAESALVPEKEIPETGEQVVQRGLELVQKYPGDPRAHFIAAFAELNNGNAGAAEQHLREALEQQQKLRGRVDFRPGFEIRLRLALANQLLARGETEEARQTMLPVCKANPNDRPAELFQEIAQLCP